MQEDLHATLLRLRLFHLNHDYREAATAKAEFEAELEQMRAVRTRFAAMACASCAGPPQLEKLLC